jgi:nicotinamide riboside transporter PnuC
MDSNIRAPFYILYAGIALLVVIFMISSFAKPQGLTAWVPLLLIWVAAFAVFIAGYALFTFSNQKKQRDPNYVTAPRRTVRSRLVYLIIGFILTSAIAWPLADELSRVWG